jgi:hypothetical protein
MFGGYPRILKFAHFHFVEPSQVISSRTFGRSMKRVHSVLAADAASSNDAAIVAYFQQRAGKRVTTREATAALRPIARVDDKIIRVLCKQHNDRMAELEAPSAVAQYFAEHIGEQVDFVEAAEDLGCQPSDLPLLWIICEAHNAYSTEEAIDEADLEYSYTDPAAFDGRYSWMLL